MRMETSETGIETSATRKAIERHSPTASEKSTHRSKLGVDGTPSWLNLAGRHSGVDCSFRTRGPKRVQHEQTKMMQRLVLFLMQTRR